MTAPLGSMQQSPASPVTEPLVLCLVQIAADSPTWHSAAAAQKLAASMLDIYSGLRSSLNQDEHRHYLLTPRHLTQWVQGLQRYSLRGTDVLQVNI